MKPATNTPAPSKGKICFINPQVDWTQVTRSSFLNQALSINTRTTISPMVMYHLAANTAGQRPVEPSAGLAKAANISIRTMVSIKRASISKVRFSLSSSGKTISPAARAASSFRKKKAMRRPVSTAKTTAPIALANPNSQPKILAVSTMARTLMAGPEYRKAVAGPIPAPLEYIPANRGRTVQEHTAKTVPDIEATE